MRCPHRQVGLRVADPLLLLQERDLVVAQVHPGGDGVALQPDRPASYSAVAWFKCCWLSDDIRLQDGVVR